ncbi:MAG: 50S ribosomal protein L4 [Spirochaetota bacterium]
MELNIYDIQGNIKGRTELNENVFNIKPNKSAIYHALRAELANQRTGTASTRGRSEVRGSGAKPWRQKGTGRARAGSRQSPIWTGGGITFGPKPRDFDIKLPRKVKRLSIKSLLSMKAAENILKVVEDFEVKSGKTGDLHDIAVKLSGQNQREKVLIVDHKKNCETSRAGRNIPWLKYFQADGLNTKDLYYSTQVIMTESAVKLLNEKYDKELKSTQSGSKK